MNLESRSVVMAAGGLPWDFNSTAMKFRALRYENGDFFEINAKRPVADEIITIPNEMAPGSSLNGEIDLAVKFGVLEYLKSDDVVIKFEYNYGLYFGPFTDPARSAVERGIVFLPRRGWFSSDCGAVFIED